VFGAGLPTPPKPPTEGLLFSFTNAMQWQNDEESRFIISFIVLPSIVLPTEFDLKSDTDAL